MTVAVWLTEKPMSSALWRACKRAGLRRVGWHILRHTFCSHLAMRGAPARVIQELAGHVQLGTTMRYMHLSPGHKEQAIRLLDRGPNLRKRQAVEATWRRITRRAETLDSQGLDAAGKGMRPARWKKEKPPTDRGFSTATGAGKDFADAHGRFESRTAGVRIIFQACAVKASTLAWSAVSLSAR